MTFLRSDFKWSLNCPFDTVESSAGMDAALIDGEVEVEAFPVVVQGPPDSDGMLTLNASAIVLSNVEN